MHGKPSAKLVPAHHLDDLLTDGAGFAGFAAGDLGQGPHDPDMIAIPDPASFTMLPWKPTVARFACDVTVEGEPVAVLSANDPAQRARAGQGSSGSS